MIGRGSTPTIEFTLKEINPVSIVVAYLTINQNGVTILEKDITTMERGVKSISWELTQEETLLFDEKANCVCQIRARTADGKAYDSPLGVFKILEILKDGVI